MPWKQVSPMDERKRFVTECYARHKTMSQLCADYGISRKTGYKWLRRYHEYGEPGLQDRSSAPRNCPHATAGEVVRRLVELREQYPQWGPKKLIVLLDNELGDGTAPSASTAGEILRQHGLVTPRKRKRRSTGHAKQHPLSEPRAANDVWAVDFKGWFRTRDKAACHPLTVSDLYSHYVLLCQGYVRQRLEQVEKDFEQLFQRCGLPKAIRMDNGTPFGSCGLGGLSRLSIKWLKLGINLEFIEPGKPQQNGSHERMHRTLKLEAVIPPARDLAEQQARFDTWRQRFNELRPHEALGQRTPASLYAQSSRSYEGDKKFSYPSYFETRYVRHDGMFSWQGRLRFVGEAFSKDRIGLLRDHEGRWLVFAGDMLVGCQPEENASVQGIESLPGMVGRPVVRKPECS